MQQKKFNLSLLVSGLNNAIPVNLSQRKRERGKLVCDIKVGKSTNSHQSHAFCQVTLSGPKFDGMSGLALIPPLDF